MSPTATRELKNREEKGLFNSTYVVVDIETTGLSPVRANIIELAAIKIKSGKKIEHFHSLVNPGYSVPPFITSLTGISNSDVKDAPYLEDIFSDFVRFLGSSTIVAHNAPFDLRFLNHAAEKIAGVRLPHHVICTLKIARRLTPQLQSKTLDNLARFYEVEFKNRHRALGDVEATTEVFLNQLQTLESQGITKFATFSDWLDSSKPSAPFRVTKESLTKYSNRHSPHEQSEGKVPHRHSEGEKRPKNLYPTPDLKNKIHSLPKSPGVYVFLDKEERPIYVGKSKSLKSRVSSYFQKSSKKDPKVEKINRYAVEIDIHLAGSDLEATLLESKMIKEYLPRYNVLQRNYRQYPFLKLALNDPFPWIEVTREIQADGSRYFGPFLSRKKVEEATRELGDLFKIRKCSGNFTSSHRPGIYYQLGTCSAPCSGLLTTREYNKQFDKLLKFLELKDTGFLKELVAEREMASKEQKYETAGRVNKQISLLTNLLKFNELTSSAIHHNHCLITTPSVSKVGVLKLFLIASGRLLKIEEIESLDSIKICQLVEYANDYGRSPYDPIAKEEIDEITIIAKWLKLNKKEGRVIRFNWDDKRKFYIDKKIASAYT